MACAGRRTPLGRLAEKDRPGRPASNTADQVDTDQHGGLLQKFGLNPADLISMFTGGGGGGRRGLLKDL